MKLLGGFFIVIGLFILFKLYRMPKEYKDIGIEARGYGAAFGAIFLGIYLLGR